MVKMGWVIGLVGLVLMVVPITADDVGQKIGPDQGPVSADTVNPYELLDLTREQLVERFPSLSEAELDRLLFKIADINSMKSVDSN